MEAAPLTIPSRDQAIVLRQVPGDASGYALRRYRNFEKGLETSLQIGATDFHEPTQYSIAIGRRQFLKGAS
jgi:hypothetical protein